MKSYHRSSVFWALLALNPFQINAFIPAQACLCVARPTGLQSTAIIDHDSYQNNQGNERACLQGFEKYTSMLMDPGITKLPSNVLDSAFEIIFECSKPGTVESAGKVEKLLERFGREDAEILENKHFALAVEAWDKCGKPRRSESILNRMQELSKSNPQISPTKATFNVVLGGYIKNGDTDAAYQFLERMEESNSISPNTHDYNTVLTALARQGKPRKAEDLMKRMVDSCKKRASSDSAPDLHSYNMLLISWAKSHEDGADTRAMEILEALQTQADQGEIALQPDERTYSAVFSSLVRSDQPGSVQRAQKLFDQALALDIIPDQYMYAVLMDAYASIGDAEKAEELIQQLEKDGMANPVSYNTAIKAWRASSVPEAPERAEAILNRMLGLGLADTISYTTVISAYANRGDTESAQRAQLLLSHMQELYEQGNDNVKPNCQTFNTVMNAWVRCGDVVEAEKLLCIVENLGEAGEDICPNVVSYSTVMNGWANSKEKDGLQRAERLFQKLNDIYESGNTNARPNEYIYVSFINAIVKSRDENSAQRAEDVLFQMYRQYKDGYAEVKPNTQLITTVIDCWQKSRKTNAGERAEALLDWMLRIYEEENDDSFRPNEYTFSTTIAAWSKSRGFGKFIKAYNVLQRMKDLYEAGTLSAAPNTHCFTAVINSCAYCENDALEKRDALKVALATYKELERTPDYGRPNQVTYATILTALRNLLPPSDGRTAAAVSIFTRCCATGQMDKSVIQRLHSILTTDEFKCVFPDSLIAPDGSIDMQKLPAEWHRNLKV